METVLVTGGAGYIGSHTVLDLIKNQLFSYGLRYSKGNAISGRQ